MVQVKNFIIQTIEVSVKDRIKKLSIKRKEDLKEYIYTICFFKNDWF